MGKLINGCIGAGVACVCVWIGGCGVGHTAVIEAPVSGQHFQTVMVAEEGSTATVPADEKADFATQLHKELYKRGFADGEGLKITYRFVQYDEGSRAARHWLGGIGHAGEGTLSVEAAFAEAGGKHLGKITVEGKVEGGLFGGGFSTALEKAAEQIAEYAGRNFK